jgi:hypothetical protein
LNEASSELWGSGDRRRFSVYSPAEEDVAHDTARMRTYSKGRRERCMLKGAEGRGY